MNISYKGAVAPTINLTRFVDITVNKAALRREYKEKEMPEKSIQTKKKEIPDEERASFSQLVKKQNQLLMEWENSIEGILSNTTTFIGCDSPGEDDEVLVGKVLQKLPKKIRTYIQENIQFFIANSSSYYKIESQFQKSCTIVLRFEEGDSAKKKMTTLAHEIAHAWLLRNNHSPNGGLKEERRTDDLCEKWGFGRAYKNYKMFERFEKIKKGK